MALRPIKRDLIINEGLNENIHPKLLPEGILSEALNVILDERGVAYSRRGFDADLMQVLGPLGPYSSLAVGDIARLLSPGNGELSLLDDKYVWTKTEAGPWAPKSHWGSLKGERVGFWEDSSGDILEADVAYSDGVLCVVYRVRDPSSGDGAIYAAILDAETGSVIRAHEAVHSGDPFGPPRVIVVNNTFVCCAHKDLTGIFASKKSATAPSSTWTTSTSLVTTNDPQFDICPGTKSGASSEFIVGSYDVAAARIYFTRFNISLANQGSTFVGTDGTTTHKAMSLYDDGSVVHAGFLARVAASNNVLYQQYSYTLGSPVAGTVATGLNTDVRFENDRVCVCAIPSLSRAIVCWGFLLSGNGTSGGAGNNYSMAWRGVNTGSGANVGNAHVLPWHTPVAQPIVENEQFVLLLAGTTWMKQVNALQLSTRTVVAEGVFAYRVDPTLFSSDNTRGTLIGVYQVEEGVGMISAAQQGANGMAVRGMAAASDDTFYFASQLLVQNADESYVGSFPTNVRGKSIIQRLIPSDFMRGRELRCAQGSILLGGAPCLYDGFSTAEFAAAWRPVIHNIGFELPTGSGNLNPAGVDTRYQYQAVVKWTSRRGDVFYSQPSLIGEFSFTTADVNLVVDIRVPTIMNKGDWFPRNMLGAQLQLYRTLANEDANNGTQLVDEQPIPTEWNTGSGQLTFTDSLPDVNLQVRDFIPFVGGEFQNTALPSASAGCVANERFFLISDEKKNRVYYSKPALWGRAPEFSVEFLYLDFPEDLVGCEAQDGVPHFFSESGIYSVEGVGPGRSGGGQVFNVREVFRGIGCTQSQSIVATPAGIVFANEIGPWILSRGGAPKFIGGGIRKTFATFFLVLSARLDTEHNAVRLLCNGQDGSQVLCWNWERDAWYVHEYEMGFPIDMVQIEGDYHLAVGTTVYNEQPLNTAYSDAGDFFPMAVQLGPIATEDGLEGFKRLWYATPSLVAKGNYGLRITCNARYGTTSFQSVHDKLEAGLDTLGADATMRVHLKYQTGSFHTIRVETLEPLAGGGTQGFEMSGITCEFGVKQGVGKRPAVAKM